MGSKDDEVAIAKSIGRSRGKNPRRLAECAKSQAAKTLSTCCLVFALFGGGFWQLCNFPDEPSNTVLDYMMTTVFGIFVLEIIANVCVDKSYPLSFFFFMDIIGSASMIFEVSYAFGAQGSLNVSETGIDPFIMRTARVAKTAARAGRLLKLTKFVDVIIRRKRVQEEVDTTKVLSAKLMLVLSTKVSLLTIIMVIVFPLLEIGQYPEEDLSMKVWGQQLEDSYEEALQWLADNPQATSTPKFEVVVNKLGKFYEGVDYVPYMLTGYPENLVINGRMVTIPGQALLKGSPPARLQNIVLQEVAECQVLRPGCQANEKAAMYIDFESVKKLQSTNEMVLSVFVIAVMMICAFNLSSTIDRMVVKPLARMIAMVRAVSSTILTLVDAEEADKEKPEEVPDETQLLEAVINKLTKVSSIALAENAIDTRDMSMEAKGIVVDLMGMEEKSSMHTRTSDEIAVPLLISELCDDDPRSKLELDSWDTDVLSLRREDLEQFLAHLFYDSPLAGVFTNLQVDLSVHFAFCEVALNGYGEQPYHCATHAVDVLHSVYRFLTLTRAQHWISGAEIYALLIAALCHDLGHIGRTNQFLIETGHALAIQYNDASPLENMHCAKCFEICSMGNTNVFANLAIDQYKRARKVILSCILHTDNIHHFDMVKDLNKLYEVHSDVIDRQGKRNEEDPVALLCEFDTNVLRKETLMLMQLFLHFADISNPCKPFEQCRPWAMRVLQEFFEQGDEEKALGLPVGMLNDREKVNKPGSQHGFINFLVAPLVVATVKIFSPLHGIAEEMALNMRHWRRIWVDEASPTGEEAAKRDAEINKISDTLEWIKRRRQPDSPDEVAGHGRRRSFKMPF